VTKSRVFTADTTSPCADFPKVAPAVFIQPILPGAASQQEITIYGTFKFITNFLAKKKYQMSPLSVDSCGCKLK